MKLEQAERLYRQDPENWDYIRNYANTLLRLGATVPEIIENMGSSLLNQKLSIWCSKEAIRNLSPNHPPGAGTPSLEYQPYYQLYLETEEARSNLRAAIKSMENYSEGDELVELATGEISRISNNFRHETSAVADIIFDSLLVVDNDLHLEMSNFNKNYMAYNTANLLHEFLLKKKNKWYGRNKVYSSIEELFQTFLNKRKNPMEEDWRIAERKIDLNNPKSIIDYLRSLSKTGKTNLYFSFLLKYYRRTFDNYKLIKYLEKSENSFLSELLDKVAHEIANEAFSEYEVYNVIPDDFYTSTCLRRAFAILEGLKSENNKTLEELFEIFEECPEGHSRSGEDSVFAMFTYYIYHTAVGSGIGFWDVCPEIKLGHYECFTEIPAPYIVTVGHPEVSHIEGWTLENWEWDKKRESGECKIGRTLYGDLAIASSDWNNIPEDCPHIHIIWEAEYNSNDGSTKYTPESVYSAN